MKNYLYGIRLNVTDVDIGKIGEFGRFYGETLSIALLKLINYHTYDMDDIYGAIYGSVEKEFNTVHIKCEKIISKEEIIEVYNKLIMLK